MCATGAFVAAELERDVEHVLLPAGNLLKNKFDFPFKLLTNTSGGKPKRTFWLNITFLFCVRTGLFKLC